MAESIGVPGLWSGRCQCGDHTYEASGIPDDPHLCFPVKFLCSGKQATPEPRDEAPCRPVAVLGCDQASSVEHRPVSASGNLSLALLSTCTHLGWFGLRVRPYGSGAGLVSAKNLGLEGSTLAVSFDLVV